MLEINNTTKYRIDLKKTKAVVEEFLRVYKKAGWEVSLAIIGDARMRRLNHEYRGIDKTTDVLSFPAADDLRAIEKPAGVSQARLKPDKYLGEIIINIQEAKRMGKYREMFKELGLKAADPYLFYFLLVHGLLHLAGYDDKTEKGRREMLKRGKDFLKFIF